MCIRDSGDAAIVICGSWLPNEAKDSVAEDLEWGYFNYPSVPDGKDDNTANNIANQVLAINKDSKMADEAFQLIEYITTCLLYTSISKYGRN